MKDFLSDDLVDFDDLSHTYTNSRTKDKYISVTTLIKQYEPEFNTEYWSAREAVKRWFGERSYQYSRFRSIIRDKEEQVVYDYIERSTAKHELKKIQEEVKREWKAENTRAINKGSAFHARQEDKLNFNKFRLLNKDVRRLADTTGIPRSGGNKINVNPYLPDGAYAELLVKNHKLKIAGQIDYLYIETINGVRYVDVDDYKTNKKLTFENPWQNFLPPINFLQHTKINIYRLQLLLYCWMLTEYGYVIRHVTITHQPDIYREPTILPVFRFLNEENPVKLLLEARKRELRMLNL